MARPKGSPKLGGRKKGTPNKATAKKAEEIAASGLTPLEYMLQIMRDERQTDQVRLDAAKAAAPYVHPKLANVELHGKDGGPLQVQVVRFGANGSNPQ
jgi:hypothetical protein